MAKKIRFPLKMNGTEVRTIEELRENFDLESVLGYFANGKLATWLKDRYYDNEAMAVESLSADDEKLHQKLCSILKVSYTEENSIDIATVRRRNEKLAFLKQVNDGEKWISKVDAVAFNQEDLLDILDTGTEKMIYLYEGDFEIPLTVKNITYFGINNPSVLLRAYDNVNFSSLNLKFVDLCFGWDVSNVSSADRMYQAETLFNLGKYDESIEILEKLAEEDNPRACWLLSIIYDEIKINDEKADKFGNKVADMGDVIALCSYERKNPFKVKTLKRLAEKNDAIAQNILGWCYGRGKGVEQSLEKAVEWYRKSAEQGYTIAQCNLGLCYEYGKGVKQNGEKAKEWYRKSTEKGYAFEYNDSNVQYNFGECFYYGKNGFKQNYKKAVEWYHKSAKQGNASAQYSLGWCYEKGEGIEQSWEKAVEWYQKSAEQGNEKAQNSLDFCYRKIKQNNEETLDLVTAITKYSLMIEEFERMEK